LSVAKNTNGDISPRVLFRERERIRKRST